jgi:hypothetical protein
VTRAGRDIRFAIGLAHIGYVHVRIGILEHGLTFESVRFWCNERSRDDEQFPERVTLRDRHLVAREKDPGFWPDTPLTST